MIYDDVELGEEGGCNSSLDNGWSSSEFESYDEASDGEGRPENGLPHAFMRGKPPQRKTHVCIRITFPVSTLNMQLRIAGITQRVFHTVYESVFFTVLILPSSQRCTLVHSMLLLVVFLRSVMICLVVLTLQNHFI